MLLTDRNTIKANSFECVLNIRAIITDNDADNHNQNYEGRQQTILNAQFAKQSCMCLSIGQHEAQSLQTSGYVVLTRPTCWDRLFRIFSLFLGNHDGQWDSEGIENEKFMYVMMKSK